MAAELSNIIPDRVSQRFELAHHQPTSKIRPVGPVRILIDGFSVLHACREELPQTAPHTAKAQDWLAHKCLKYQDAMGQPITLFFDGKGTGGKPSRVESNPHLEILYSQGNQTADYMIERVTHRLLPYGPVVVVTNDHAERETILSMGGEVQSCEAFMEEMRQCSEVASPDLARYLRRDR